MWQKTLKWTEHILRWVMTSLSTLDKEKRIMLGLIQSEAAQGDAEAIRTLAFLREIKLIKDEPKVKKELELWEILEMCVAGSRARRRRY